MRVVGAFAVIWFASGLIGSCGVRAEDLTLPPELRSAAPPRVVQPDEKGAGKLKRDQHPPAPVAASDGPGAPSTAPEDRIGFMTKWNASNTAETATRATSGLSEANKNHDGESAGAGAQVGFKYKF